MFGDKILYFFNMFLLFSYIGIKSLHLKIMNYSKTIIFLSIHKNNKKIYENIQFGLEAHFRTKRLYLMVRINYLNFESRDMNPCHRWMHSIHINVASPLFIYLSRNNF